MSKIKKNYNYDAIESAIASERSQTRNIFLGLKARTFSMFLKYLILSVLLFYIAFEIVMWGIGRRGNIPLF